MKRVLRGILSHYGLDHMAKAHEILNQCCGYETGCLSCSGLCRSQYMASLHDIYGYSNLLRMALERGASFAILATSCSNSGRMNVL